MMLAHVALSAGLVVVAGATVTAAGAAVVVLGAVLLLVLLADPHAATVSDAAVMAAAVRRMVYRPPQSRPQKPALPSARPTAMFFTRRPAWPVRIARPVAEMRAAL